MSFHRKVGRFGTNRPGFRNISSGIKEVYDDARKALRKANDCIRNGDERQATAHFRQAYAFFGGLSSIDSRKTGQFKSSLDIFTLLLNKKALVLRYAVDMSVLASGERHELSQESVHRLNLVADYLLEPEIEYFTKTYQRDYGLEAKKLKSDLIAIAIDHECDLIQYQAALALSEPSYTELCLGLRKDQDFILHQFNGVPYNEYANIHLSNLSHRRIDPNIFLSSSDINDIAQGALQQRVQGPPTAEITMVSREMLPAYLGQTLSIPASVALAAAPALPSSPLSPASSLVLPPVASAGLTLAPSAPPTSAPPTSAPISVPKPIEPFPLTETELDSISEKLEPLLLFLGDPANAIDSENVRDYLGKAIAQNKDTVDLRDKNSMRSIRQIYAVAFAYWREVSESKTHPSVPELLTSANKELSKYGPQYEISRENLVDILDFLNHYFAYKLREDRLFISELNNDVIEPCDSSFFGQCKATLSDYAKHGRGFTLQSFMSSLGNRLYESHNWMPVNERLLRLRKFGININDFFLAAAYRELTSGKEGQEVDGNKLLEKLTRKFPDYNPDYVEDIMGRVNYLLEHHPALIGNK